MGETISRDRETAMEKVMKILSKSIDELDDRDIRELASLLPEAISELPQVTRTGVEKLKLYQVLKQLIQDLEESRR
ncbi:MAG: hypothetical protein GXO23_01640 [Crenarchaeota archaeon]|nr:hypothetical protein [Thermoproteota archaeon]